jgi:DNA-binding transcriptional regulator YiaG
MTKAVTPAPAPAATERTLEQLRTLLGFDVATWARIFGVPPITITRWEDGTKPSGVAAEVFRGIEAALDAGVSRGAIRSRLKLGLAQLLRASLGAP